MLGFGAVGSNPHVFEQWPAGGYLSLYFNLRCHVAARCDPSPSPRYSIGAGVRRYDSLVRGQSWYESSTAWNICNKNQRRPLPALPTCVPPLSENVCKEAVCTTSTAKPIPKPGMLGKPCEHNICTDDFCCEEGEEFDTISLLVWPEVYRTNTAIIGWPASPMMGYLAHKGLEAADH